MNIARFEDLESRRLLSAAAAVPWSINGDTDADNFDDAIDVSANGASLVATVNGNIVGTRDASKVKLISISSGRGDDVISIDLGDYANQIQVSIDAGAGKDVVVAGDEADSINGGTGNDTIESGAGNDTISGGGGTDVINDSPPTDYTKLPALVGGSGAGTTAPATNVTAVVKSTPARKPTALSAAAKPNPVPAPNATPWIINGDADSTDLDDFIDVSVSDDDPTKLVATVNGNVVDTRAASSVKSITINSGAGDDDISVDLGDYSKNIKVTINAGAGDDFVTAGDESDVIYGGAGSDTLDGGGGNDSIYGGAGPDDLSGGDGNDVINGGGNDDTVAGDWGNDSLDGGSGSDDLQGGAGKDSETGDNGNDTLYGGDGSDKIDGGAGSNSDYIDDTDRVIRYRHDHFNPDELPTYGRLQTQANLTQWWIDRAVAQYEYLFGHNWYYFRGVDNGLYPVAYALNSGVDTTSQGTSTTTDNGTTSQQTSTDTNNVTDTQMGLQGSTTTAPIHSTTNDQEVGVDEADLVQTDGRYIYTLTGNSLVVVDTTTAGGPSVVSTTAVDGSVSGIYLDGDRLTLVGQTYDGGIIPFSLAARPGLLWRSFGATQVTVMDVSNPAMPSTVSVTNLDGTLSDSRMIDGRLYVVVGDSMVHGPEPLQTGTDSDGNPIYETEAQYRARLEADPSLLTTPKSTTTANGQTTTTELISAPDIYIPQNASDSWIDQGDITSVVLIDTHDLAPAPKSTTSIVGYGDTVYASQDAMYLATYDWTNQGTRILKFGLGTEDVGFEASGGVEGSVNDRFSMGESNGIFRIATTTEPWFDFSDDGTVTTDGVESSSVFTLTQDGAKLKLLGSLTGLSPNESIQSVRFVGDRAYISTFHQTDPLLSIDLSDAANPMLVGQLVVPGFSSYLQPLSDTLLMGLGQYADPTTGATDWSGVEVSLFDVSDPAHPKEINAVELNPSSDQSYADSEAQWDPHAITYIPDQHILALPVNGDLELLNVDATNGLSEAAVIPADTNDTIHRTVRIDGDVFAVGDTHITERAFADLSQNVASVRIAPDPQQYYYPGEVIPFVSYPAFTTVTSYSQEAV